jgi:hypothetical protein
MAALSGWRAARVNDDTANDHTALAAGLTGGAESPRTLMEETA